MKNNGTIIEHRIHCNVCGKIYCYTEAEAANNKTEKAAGVITLLIGGITAALGAATPLESAAMHATGTHTLEKITDYTKCPHCHSSDIYETTAEVKRNMPSKPKKEAFTTDVMDIPKRNHQK